MATEDGAARKIVVIAPSWVGDMVMAQPFFALLAEQYPGSTIDAVAPPATFPLIGRIPEINKGTLLPVAHGEFGLRKRHQVAAHLKAEGYDQAIVLPNSFKSALLPALARIPRRTGWRGEFRYGLLNDLRVLNPNALPLMVDRFRALALNRDRRLPEQQPRPMLRVDADGLAQALLAFELEPSRRILALCPGAEYGEAKRWPAGHYAEVAVKFIEAGWQAWIFGSAADREIAERLTAMIPAALQRCCVNLAGRTTLPQAVDLISITTAVLTNDSGLMHIAAALERPLWVIYGSSSPRFTPPLSDLARIVSLELDCSPCFQRTCPLGHRNCLEMLTSALVLQEMAKDGLLNSYRPR